MPDSEITNKQGVAIVSAFPPIPPKRQRWFDRGCDAFARTTKGTLPRGYLCPLCYEGDGKPFRLYHQDALRQRMLSEEDVPPRNIGGRRIVLTCKDCNSKAGHTVDAELRKLHNVADFWSGELKKSRACSIQINGMTLNVRAQWENNQMVLADSGRLNKPSLSEGLNNELHRMVEQNVTDWDFTLTMEQDGWRQGWPEISILRASYLAAFAAFGYGYILNPSLNPVRNQIRNYETRTLACFGSFFAGMPSTFRRIGIITSPEELEGLAVQIGGYVTILPSRHDDIHFYDQIADGMKARLTAKEWPWPTGPEFSMDFAE